MNVLNEIIEKATYLILNGGWIFGFTLVMIESFIPILPLGAFVALNTNAFGFVNALLISWSATVIGSYLMFLLCRYISNKYIFKLLSKKKKNKLLKKIDLFKEIKFTQLVLIITVPFTPSCFINLLAGISNISKEKYISSLIIGKAFMITFWAFIGKSFIESITNIKAIIYILIILIIAYLISKFISKKYDIE